MINAFKIALYIIEEYWWVIAPVALFFIFRELWLEYVRTRFVDSIDWCVLEIKIPRESQKTPKAMEQVFAGLHGIKHGANFVEKWFKGEIQTWISLEMVGDNGEEMRFFVKAPRIYRNLIEAQFYAQYPDAEINEIDDYINILPSNIPSKDYNIWGAELILTKPDAYPIQTYPYFFEASKEEERIDPLTSVAETINNIHPGEHIWIQILIRPTGDSWKKEGEKLVEKLIGKKVKATKRGLIIEETHNWIVDAKESFHELFFGPIKSKESAKKTEESPKNLLLNLTPGQREVITAIERNISKLGFETMIRFVYWAKSDIFSSANKIAILGAFKQFNTQNLNGFKPNKKNIPSIDYWFKKRREFYRKMNILNDYKKRYFSYNNVSGRAFVFNTEELATIFHIPGRAVPVSAVPRIKAKKGVPPADLPTK